MNRLRYNQIGVSPPLSIRNSLRLAAHIQLLPVLESGEETLVGGQAVMEGVMMRAPHSYCVAVRKADRRNRHRRDAAGRSVGEVPDLQVPGASAGSARWSGDVARA